MNELINNLKNKKYRFVKSRAIGVYGNPQSAVIHKIISVKDDGVLCNSNMVKGGLDIFHRFPKEGNYKLIPDGYIEDVECGRFGTVKKETVFLTEFPFSK